MDKHTYENLHSGGGIIVTYKCTAACLHCCYSSSPNRSGDYMSESTADKIFRGLKSLSCHSVHIGGGEPFINFDGLLAVCKSADKNGVGIDYIETNASWAVDKAKTDAKLSALKAAGVDCLLISADPFHNEFIPFERVRFLADRCDKNNMSYFIWQQKYIGSVSGLDESKPHSLEEYKAEFGENYLAEASRAYGMHYNGRAILLSDMINAKKPAPTFLDGNTCGITSASHFHVDLNGYFIPPSCTGFQLLFDDILNDGISGGKYKNFLAVKEGGLSALYKIAAEAGFTPNPDGYSCKCSLCFDIKKYLKGNCESFDTGPDGFFDERGIGMSETVDKIRETVLEKCGQHKKNPEWGYYDYWNDHIKRVVYHAVNLANQYGADTEIVELGALLHDISMPSEYGDRSEHNVFSAEMAEKLLKELNYPQNKIDLVKKCVFNHPNSVRHLRETIEEYCVSDADALAHFDRIPSLFSLAYNVLKMPLEEGREYVKEKLQGDYDGLSDRTKQLYKSKYETIMATVFVD